MAEPLSENPKAEKLTDGAQGQDSSYNGSMFEEEDDGASSANNSECRSQKSHHLIGKTNANG